MCCSGFFVLYTSVKLKPVKLAPALIAVGVIILFCVFRVFNTFERLEKITYDWRAREAMRFPAPTATNLGAIYIDDGSIAYIKTNHLPNSVYPELGYRFGLQWPRQVYGRLVEQLAAEHAKAVGLDVVFGELREDHPPVQLKGSTNIESDAFFAMQMRLASNVVIAVTKDVFPAALFATNAAALGAIDADKDPDGVLRRARAFETHRKWHLVFQKIAADPEFGVDLDQFRIEPGQLVLLRSTNVGNIVVPLDKEGNFSVLDFLKKVPPGMPAKDKPFVEERIWHMGIVLAARELGLDLDKPEIDLPHGKITLRGPNGIERSIPVNENGYFYVDWRIRPNDPHLTQAPIQEVLLRDKMRLDGKTTGLVDQFAGKLVVVGSIATGNDLRDEGATPLSTRQEPETFLMSKHWNVANSVITGRFIQRSPLWLDLLIIVISGTITALLIWNLPIRLATGVLILLAAIYIAAVTMVYVHDRYWLPLVLPLSGTWIMMYASLAMWRVVFEQAEQRRVKSVFSRMVSQNIMDEVLRAKKLSLGGARREVTVLFADVRGFTEFTDNSQEKAAAYVAEHKLSAEDTEAFYDEQARETLQTVNTYLTLVSDQVKKHDGTVDKYIGDCVMAFWGAPTPMSQQALYCVRAAIDAQRAVFELNKQRVQINEKRELENMARQSAGLTPKPLLPILLLGTGINTGQATAGIMGSEEDRINYTIFGREVNLASRLESLSGRGRILISEATYNCLLRDDSKLAATCTVLPDLQKLKGFGAAVKVYEVPWRLPGESPFDEEFATKIFGEAGASTNFIKREKM